MRRVEKPWGHEVIFAETDLYVGKILHVEKDEQLSLQYHEIKDETIYLATGSLEVELKEGDELVAHVLSPGEARHIPPGTVHRMRALSTCDIFEVSTPHIDDVVRLEDRYGRAER
ncbi:MAG: cupin domain-containing protein [Acidobacteriota bacterium]